MFYQMWAWGEARGFLVGPMCPRLSFWAHLDLYVSQTCWQRSDAPHSGTCRNLNEGQKITHLDPLLNESCATLRDINNRCKDPSRATQGSDTKTLRSPLLRRYLQLDSTILAIRGSSYAARSSPRSKRYNAHI